jgi:CRISPR system Cascade subunit CasD
MQHLLFTLAAPLASFGTIAVGERRPTWDRPSKSQIIGLVAGALGIERSEEERQRTLTSSLGFAVRIDHPGTLLADYHTAQTAPQVSLKRRAKAGNPVRTRADELDCADLKTILSRRDYRVGSLHTICLWGRGEAGSTLETIGAAIAAPAFVPFAGRKANALMLPMRPQLVEAEAIEAAFTGYDAGCPKEVRELIVSLEIEMLGKREIFTDTDGVRTGVINRIEERRDIPESRAKWRFGPRREILLRDADTKGGTP